MPSLPYRRRSCSRRWSWVGPLRLEGAGAVSRFPPETEAGVAGAGARLPPAFDVAEDRVEAGVAGAVTRLPPETGAGGAGAEARLPPVFDVAEDRALPEAEGGGRVTAFRPTDFVGLELQLLLGLGSAKARPPPVAWGAEADAEAESRLS